MAQMPKFFGHRHVPILPYNAQVKGATEAAVKRIKLVLDKHVEGYDDWHKILPLAQLLIHCCHVHTGTQLSAFAALFGYVSFGIEHLENPALLPQHGSGSEWLIEIRRRKQDGFPPFSPSRSLRRY